jgi:hypothetical protein
MPIPVGYRQGLLHFWQRKKAVPARDPLRSRKPQQWDVRPPEQNQSRFIRIGTLDGRRFKLLASA